MSMEMTAWSALRQASAEAERRPWSWATVRRAAAFARPDRARVGWYLAASVVAAVLAVGTPLIAGAAVNAIVRGDPLATVVRLAALLAGLAVAEAGLSLASRYLSATVGEGLILRLRTTVFDHVQRLPVAFFARTQTGALVSRLNTDVLGAQRAFSETLAGLVSNVVALVLTLAVMVSVSWPVTVLVLVLLPAFLLPARRTGRRLAGLQREAAGTNAAMSSWMTERFSASGATLVKLYGDDAAESAGFADRARRVRDIGVRTAMLQHVFMTSLVLVASLALALVYGVGGGYALAGRLEPGAVVALALLLTRLYAPLTALAGARVEVTAALVSFERVFEVLDLPTRTDTRAEPRPLPDGPLEMTFDAVRFGYPSAEHTSLASLRDVARTDSRPPGDVLHDVSFRVRAGRVVALVGASGAGKSTIAQLVARLYDPGDGTVRLGGRDLRDVPSKELRSAIGMVTQDCHLFHDTVRGNLLFARPHATEAELWHALAQARLSDLVAGLPDGLDTVVGDRGHLLSGGERQRLAIARLLLARPRLVVLDEATAHLDAVSETAVQAALDEALTGRTAVVIAHRLSTVRNADEILVIEDGRVAERGRHTDLLAAEGRYARLYHTQFDVSAA